MSEITGGTFKVMKVKNMKFWFITLLIFSISSPLFSKLTAPQKMYDVSYYKEICDDVDETLEIESSGGLEDLSFNCSGLDFSIKDGRRAVRDYRKSTITQQELVDRHLNPDETKIFFEGVLLLRNILELSKSKVKKDQCKRLETRFLFLNQLLRKDIVTYTKEKKIKLSLDDLEIIHIQNLGAGVSNKLLHKHHLLLNLQADLLDHFSQLCIPTIN